ncbi:DUF5054 domain-containing protein [Niameybacter massiliensis]|uniref:DUF5054 domain-containing protein n=1 Tax=Niameybacter massiliensis TaxID=1658108 RepID=UPI0006B4894C|nr:DUF5054 domain-containing protein [Niameybacter massiliensis]
MDKHTIKKVHVVYKTHLDIGFTNFGYQVLDNYLNQFIPKAIDLALKLNTKEDKKFIWTVGSYLIDYYLKHASQAEQEKLVCAIKDGSIRWHGIACTTHTEAMNEALLEYSLNISTKLDEQFGTHTISSKMTDVPGHTRGMVKHLAKRGICYLHIGVNPSSMVPNVPPIFRWQDGEDEVIVHYSAGYGKELLIDGFDEVLEFAHTGDNLGPQSEEDILNEIDRIQKLYPHATIQASSLDEFAKSILTIKDRLPVVKEEIGDTWIHGISSDPKKIAEYKELLRLRDEWMKAGLLKEEDQAYDGFMMNLLMIAEHTWGLDFKKYLADFKNWSKEDFKAAREADATTLEFLTYRNNHMLEVLEYDIEKYRDGHFTGSYQTYEASHTEQRDYIKKAVEALPSHLQQQAQEALERLRPQAFDRSGEEVFTNRILEVGGWNVKVGAHGQLTYLENNEKVWLEQGEVGRLQYDIYDVVDVATNYYQYNRNFLETCSWSEGDFSKPGLEFVEDLKSRCYDFTTRYIVKDGNQLKVSLFGDEQAAKKYGMPNQAQIYYTFEADKVSMRVEWLEKEANKIPEAIWLKVQFDVDNPYRWQMNKLGAWISPFDVVRGGNRKQHGVEALAYDGADGAIHIHNIHSPIVSIGDKNIYKMDNKVDSLEEGFYFNLFNNRWGTNFCQWCEDDCAFEYEITFNK